MSTISISCCFALILVITLLLPRKILCNDHHNDLVTKTCEKTRYKDLCIASLRSRNESKGVDLQGLAKVSLKIVSHNAAGIYHHVSKLLNKTVEPFLRQCLTDCSENFQYGITQIEDSIAAIDSKNYNDVQTWVTAAMSYEESCEDGFMEKPGYKSPLTRRNRIFTQLCSITLSITNLLAGTGTKA